jgi:hypothetical protein
MSEYSTTTGSQDSTLDYCENCGVRLQGEFCHTCGQSRQKSTRYFGTIMVELLDNLFSFDSRVFRTLVPLMLIPGFVCSEYLSGKRARFLPPFRLYLFSSIIFFLLIPWVEDISMSFTREAVDTEQQQQAEENVAGYLTLNVDDEKTNVLGIRDDLPEVDEDIPFFVEELKLLREKLNNIANFDTDELLETSLNILPTLMFFLLPLLALTLKLLYLFSNRYYMEHLIVVLYSQSALFFMLLFANALEIGQQLLLNAYPSLAFIHTVLLFVVNLAYIWIPTYIFFFMKKVYGQSTLLTLTKFSAISIIYMILVATTVTATLVWGLFKI